MNQNLHQLVQSLSGSEKRYFRLFCNREGHRQSDRLLMVYDYLSGEAEFSDVGFKAAFEGEAFMNQPESLVFALRNQLLRGLESFHYQGSPAAKARSFLTQIDLLFDKSQFYLCRQAVGRALRHARKYELFESELELIRWEIRLIKRDARPGLSLDLRESWQREDQLLQWMQLERDLRRAHDRIWAQLAQVGLSGEPEKAFYHHSFPEMDGLPFNLAMILGYLQIFQAQLSGEEQKINAVFAEMVSKWEAKAAFIKAYPARYLLTLVGQLQQLSIENEGELIREGLEKLRGIPGKHPGLKAKVFFYSYHLELLLMLQTGQKSPNPRFAERVERGVELHGKLIGKGMLLSLVYNMLVYMWIQGFSKEALRWNDRLQNSLSAGLRKDLQEAGPALEMILLYETARLELLEIRLRQWKKRNQSLEFSLPQFTAELMEEALHALPDQLNSVWKSGLNRLKNPSVQLKQTGQKEVEIWLESRLSERTMAELLRGN